MSALRFRMRWLSGGLLAASCSLLNAGCADTVAERTDTVLPTVRLVQLPPADPAAASKTGTSLSLVPVLPYRGPTAPADKILPVAFQTTQPQQVPQPMGIRPEILPPTTPPQPEKIGQLPTPKGEKIAQLPTPEQAVVEEKVIPINLDTVLRLAEEQNAQVGIARAQLNESETEQAIAAKAWLPQVYAGTAYYRHEGGIQDFDGTLIHSSTGALFSGVDLSSEIDIREATFQRVSAERLAWQRRGELSKVTSETLLEAATTYLDLLTARRGEAVAHELEKYLLDVQERAEKMVTPEDRSAQVLVEAAQAEVSGRRQAIAKLHQQGDAASAKLAYLLGIGSCVKMAPVEETLTPIDLVDPMQTTADLVAQALTNGPGVRELQSMLTTMQAGLDRLSGPLRLMPVVSVNMAEGLFQAGPGSQLNSDNRWDLCVNVRWNLTEFVTAREKKHVAESRIEQARLNYEDLRGKLTAGVQEARDASLGGREEIRQAVEQIKHAGASYQLSDDRLKMRAPNASPMEVLQAIRGLEAAHFNHLTAINAYNKAQIRLLVLLGPAATKSCAR